MGQASHKLSGAYIAVTSKLGVAELRTIAAHAADETVGTGIYKGARARIRSNGGSSDMRSRFKIGTEKRSMMTFSVSFTANADGSTARSLIDSFLTKQATFLGIPAGPKELQGWNWYLNFMRNFEQAVRRSDSAARIQIVEQA